MPTFPKPLLLLFALSVSITFFIASGCEKNLDREVDYSIPNASEIVQQFNKGKLDHQKGEYIQSSVEIKVTRKDGHGLIDFNLNKYNSKYLHYILQVDNEDFIIEESKLEKAEIIFIHRTLVINSLTSDYRILVTVDKDENIFESLRAIEKIRYKVAGFGLIRQLNMREIDIRAPGDVHCRCCTWVNGRLWGCGAEKGTGPIEEGCDAGGVGSISCSYTYMGNSCTVSCGERSSSCCWYEKE